MKVSRKASVQDLYDKERELPERMFDEWEVLERSSIGEPTVIKVLDDQDEMVSVRESSGKVSRVGAVPFELHEAQKDKDEPNYEASYNNKNVENREASIVGSEHGHSLTIGRESSVIQTESPESVQKEDEFKMNIHDTKVERTYTKSTPLVLYDEINSMAGNVVKIYMEERNITYQLKNILFDDSTSIDEKLFLLNPEGSTPTMCFDNGDIKSNSLKIIDFLEDRVSGMWSQLLVPCTTTQDLHQKYILYASLLDNIDFEALALGLDVHSNSKLAIGLDLKKFKESWNKKQEVLNKIAGIYLLSL